MGDAEELCNRVPVGMTEWLRARGGAAHDWCQFRYYIDPSAQIDTKKRSPARHPSRASKRAILQRASEASSDAGATSSPFAACVARVITSETAWEARAKVELAMWL